jgi:hypothetical protein
MQSKHSTTRPYGYVFVEGGRVVIRGSGPLGSRLMMAMAAGWENVHCEETSSNGRSSWAIMLNSGKGHGVRQRLARMRGQMLWLMTGVAGCAGAGYMTAKGWWVTAMIVACASVGAWLYGSVRR